MLFFGGGSSMWVIRLFGCIIVLCCGVLLGSRKKLVIGMVCLFLVFWIMMCVFSVVSVMFMLLGLVVM